jgi:FKBP-type peptidyl-prolyl cis-trans isomerase (trigger factor)
LAAFLSRSNIADEALDLIEEIREFCPNAYIRRECSSLLSRLKSGFERGGRSSKSVKCISLKEAI